MNDPEIIPNEMRTSNLNSLILIEILEYNPGSDPVKTIIRKTPEEAATASFTSDDAFSEHLNTEDVWIQAILGNVKILIDGNINMLATGQCLTIPANISRQITAGNKFTLISTSIKPTASPKN